MLAFEGQLTTWPVDKDKARRREERSADDCLQTEGAMGTVTVLSCLQVCHTSQVTIRTQTKHSATAYLLS